MLVKLKWLKAWWQRDILPAPGATEGKILYTSKNATGRRTQHVIDLDNKTYTRQNIDASPADLLTEPGAVVEFTNVPPVTDASLYGFGLQQMPVIASVTTGLTQTIANGGAITAINLFNNVTIDSVVSDNTTAVITVVAEAGLTANTGTGEVTLDDNLTPGTYTATYTVEDINEPSVVVTLELSVTVDPA